MAITQVRGNTQIKPLTITNDEVDAAAAIETTKLADGPEFLWRDGSVPLTGDLDADGNKLTNLAAATNPADAVRYDQVSGSLYDEKVKVSSDDTDAKYLSEKLIGTTDKITLTVNNPAGDETYQIGIGDHVFDKSADTLADIPDGGGFYKLSEAQRDGLENEFYMNDLRGEPTGFPNRTDSTISFNDGSREFTVAPTGASFEYFIKGVKYEVLAAFPSVATISDTEGMWYIYYDGASIVASQTKPADIWSGKAYIAFLYWDAATNVAIIIGDERHGMVMDWSTHNYLHDTVGFKYENGLDIEEVGTALPQGGTSSDDGKVTITEGVLHDEDIDVSITDGSGGGIFEQILSPVAQIPVYYRDGVAGDWRKLAADDFPVYQTGTNRASYNSDPGGGWAITEATEGYYVASWVLASNNISEPIIVITGQRQDSTLTAAQDGNDFGALDLTNLPLEEVKALYRIIFKTSSTFIGGVRVAIQEFQDMRASSDVVGGGTSTPLHNTLPGRNIAPAHPASAIVPVTTSFGKALSSADDTVQKALDTLDEAAVFGTWLSQVNTPGTVTANPGPTTVQTLTTGLGMPAGDYIIQWYCEWNLDSNSADYANIGIYNGVVVYGFMAMAPFDTTINQWHPFSGYFYVTLGAGSNTFTMVAERTGNAGTVSVRRRRLIVWRAA